MLRIDAYHRRDIRLLRHTFANAQSVVVSSDIAASIMTCAPNNFRGPLLTLPIAFPATDRSDLRETRPDVAVLGWLSTSKGIARAVEILRRLREVTDARLVFVGKANDGAVEALHAAASQLDLHEQIVVTGYLPTDMLRDRLRGCRAGLRLATRTDGEMSAAVTDLVALGVPTVTNLATMGRSSPGLVVLPDATDDDLVAALTPLLVNDRHFSAARRDAIDRADAWGFANVAAGLAGWLQSSHQ